MRRPGVIRRPVHQRVVDALGAQGFTHGRKPIRLVFALTGLHLRPDHQFTGRPAPPAHADRGGTTAAAHKSSASRISSPSIA